MEFTTKDGFSLLQLKLEVALQGKDTASDEEVWRGLFIILHHLLNELCCECEIFLLVWDW